MSMARSKYEHPKLDAAGIQAEAQQIWPDLAINIDRWHEKIVPHANSCLFGYADVTVVVFTRSGGRVPFKFRGILVKELKGNPHIDMPAEAGGDGEYYAHYMPRSAAFRACLQTVIFNDPEVRLAIQKRASMPTPAPQPVAAAPSTVTAGQPANPFTPPAEAGIAPVATPVATPAPVFTQPQPAAPVAAPASVFTPNAPAAAVPGSEGSIAL